MKFEGVNIPQPGDLLFYKAHGRSWLLSRLISKLSHAAGEDSKRGRYCHVAMIGQDETLLEMTWPRSRKTGLNISKLNEHYDLELWRVRASEWTKAGAVAWAQQNLGMKYDWSLILFGLFDNKHKEVCSTFVRQAYLHGGVDLYPGGMYEKISSPSELVRGERLMRVW